MKNGNPVCACAASDITELRRAEKALTESEQRYLDLFENTTDIVFVCDTQGDIISINRAASSATDMPARNLSARTSSTSWCPNAWMSSENKLQRFDPGRDRNGERIGGARHP